MMDFDAFVSFLDRFIYHSSHIREKFLENLSNMRLSELIVSRMERRTSMQHLQDYIF